jgi:SAM-dependent methyltransferase
MRQAYAAHGVQGFYTQEASSYRNAHFGALNTALAAALDEVFGGDDGGARMLSPVPSAPDPPPPLDTNVLRLGPAGARDGDGRPKLRVLDLACGSGEASLVVDRWLRGKAGAPFGHLVLTASDPFTAAAFRERTGLPAVGGWAFEDVQEGCLHGRAFDVVVCSFALHLLDESRLFATLRELSVAARWLVICSPHKRPHVKHGCGWALVHDGVKERVHVRIFESCNVEVS